MSEPSNGITAEVIRGVMPPYHLSADLLEATFAALPRPPPDATTAWRQARITRFIEEIAAPKPADAEQARIAAQILIVRELADTITTQTHAPGTTVPQVCSLARTTVALLRISVALDRTLARRQQKPTPFFGTVVKEEVDVPALDATWRSHPIQPDKAPTAPPPRKPARAATPAPQDTASQPEPAQNHPNAAPPAAATATPVTAAAPPPTVTPTPPPADHTATQPQAQPDHAPDAASHPGPNAATTPEWSITKLDEGPGWSREVLRHRSSTPAGSATPPRSPT